MPAEHSEYPSRGRAVLMLVLLLLAYICSALDRLILPLMVGPVRNTLHITDFQVSLLQGFAFALFFAFAGVPFGWLADRVKRTSLIAAGMLLWSFMTIACGLSNSFLLLFFARMGLGVGEAALVPAGFSLLADSFEKRTLVRATAIFASGGLFGSACAYFVGGMLIDFLSANPPPLRLGHLQPWQMAFILVSVPGFVLAPLLFAMREPSRKGGETANEGVATTARYLWSHRRDYAPFYLTTTLLSIANYGGLTWFPTHMIRAFHLDATHVGVWLGSLQLAGGIVGTTLGAGLTEYFLRKGVFDAHLRTIVIISIIGVVGMIAPFATNETVALCLWFVAVINFSGYFGSSVAALQLMTPSSMRASNSALLMMIMVLGGLACGTALVGAVADLLFKNSPAGIGHSLSLVGGSACLVSIFVALLGLPRFRKVMAKQMDDGLTPDNVKFSIPTIDGSAVELPVQGHKI